MAIYYGAPGDAPEGLLVLGTVPSGLDELEGLADTAEAHIEAAL